MNRERIAVAAALMLVFLTASTPVYAQKLVFVVRHAERADDGTAAMTAQTDPPLSTTGEARAAKLAELLRDAGIRAIFATEFRRTQDTVRPLASKLGLSIQNIPATSTELLIRKLRSEHADDIVLVVGHSNTLPKIIKALGGPDVTVAENEYDNLFLVIPRAGTMTRIRFSP
jgi:broad specificity phosphatase PhoE